MNNLIIKPVDVRENYTMISKFMLHLHENEYVLFDKTAKWQDIESTYMRHIMNMQEDYEGMCFVAYVDEQPTGFIFGFLEEEDDSRFEIEVGKILYISDGYVDPHYRQRGIYSKLNKAIEAHYVAMGVRRITRLTLANNEPQQKVLESQGYKITRLMYEKWL